MVEGVIDDEPAIVRLVAPLADVEREGCDVGIDDDCTGGGCPDKILQCCSGGIEVSLEEDHLGRWCRGADEEDKLLLLLILTLFDAYEALVNTFLEGDELMVDGIALEKVALENLCCPDAELCASLALDAIAYGYDDI